MVKLMYIITPKPGMSRDEFQRYWLQTHAPIVMDIPQLERYVINVFRPRSDATSRAIGGVASNGSPPWRRCGQRLARRPPSARGQTSRILPRSRRACLAWSTSISWCSESSTATEHRVGAGLLAKSSTTAQSGRAVRWSAAT
jgi:hypothetical protein